MDGSRVDWIVENETDYYGILGVPRDASEKDIRRSYLSLALHLHPDKNLDNKKAAEAFNALNKAYNVLKDGRMRMLYDQKGVKGLHGLSADDLSFKNIVTTLARVLAAKTLISVARRLQVFEIMRENHEWVGPFIIWTPMDEFACFRKPHRDESRRFVFKAFTFVLLLLLCISLGHNAPRFLFGASHDEQEQSSLLRGPYAKLSRDNPSEPGATFTFRVLSHNGNFTDVVVWRPSSISEEEATTLVRRWVDEMCPAERLLALASRERYNYTATLRPGRKLRAPPSPNRAAKHKWEFKGWKPKFKEFFPVRSAEELYVPSPLCGVLG